MGLMRHRVLVMVVIYCAVGFLLRDDRYAQTIWLLSAFSVAPIIVIWKPKNVAEFLGLLIADAILSVFVWATSRS